MTREECEARAGEVEDAAVEEGLLAAYDVWTEIGSVCPSSIVGRPARVTQDEDGAWAVVEGPFAPAWAVTLCDAFGGPAAPVERILGLLRKGFARPAVGAGVLAAYRKGGDPAVRAFARTLG